MPTDTTTVAHCQAWLSRGFNGLVPVIPPGAPLHETSRVDPKSRGKVPGEYFSGAWDGMGGWAEFIMTPTLAERFDKLGANVGLKMGVAYVALDIDVLDEVLGRAMWDYLVGLGAPIRVGLAPKFLVLFRVKGDPVPRRQTSLRKEGVEGRQLFEVMGQTRTGRPSQVVVAGTHPSGSQYQWFSEFGPDDVPEIDAEGVEAICQQLVAIAAEQGWSAKASATDPGDGTGTSSDLGAVAPDPLLAMAIIDAIPNDELEWDDWVRIGIAIKAALGDEAGWAAFHGFSVKARKYDQKVTEKEWAGFKPRGEVGFGTLVKIARYAHGGVLPNGLEDALRGSIGERVAEAALAKMPPSDPNQTPPGAQPVTGKVMLSEQDIAMLDPKEMETARLAAAYKVAGDPIFDIFLLIASEHRFKTEFEKRVKRFESDYRLKQLKEQTTGQELILLGDPNEYMGQAIRLEQVIGAAELAFAFLENAVIIKRMRSAVGRVVRRDQHGNRIIGADGEPEADDAWTYRGKIMRKPEFLTAASSAAYFADKDGKGAMIPPQFLSHLEAVAGESLKPVASIAQHPVMWRGKLLFGDGEYHAGSGLYLATGLLEPFLWSDPAAAYHFLRHDWLGDFPFQTERDALVAIAAAATLLVVKTDLLEEAGPPITLFTAPSPSIGKSYLQTILHVGVTGAPLPTMMYPTKPEEREKLFMAAILQGYSHLAFDNLTNGSTLGNSHRELLQLTTSPSMSGRILGESTTGSGHTGLMVSMNGNGIITMGDMVSRLLECRLVPPVSMTNLVQRTFRHSNLTEWTRENRGKIVGALAAILSVQTNERKGTRFGAWSRSVASPLMEVSGVTDLFDEWIEAGEADAQGFASGQVHDLMLAMAAVCRDAEGYSTWCTASEIVAHLTITAPQLLVAIFGTVNPKPDEVSRYLKKHRDVRHDGRILRGSSENLQDRTNYKKRMVFRIE